MLDAVMHVHVEKQILTPKHWLASWTAALAYLIPAFPNLHLDQHCEADQALPHQATNAGDSEPGWCNQGVVSESARGRLLAVPLREPGVTGGDSYATNATGANANVKAAQNFCIATI